MLVVNTVKNNKWLIFGFALFLLIFLLPYDTGGNTVIVSDGRGVLFGGDPLIFQDNKIITKDGSPLVTISGDHLIIGEIVKSREKKIKRNGDLVVLNRIITEDDRLIETENGVELFVNKDTIVSNSMEEVHFKDGQKVKLTERAVLTRGAKIIIAIAAMAVIFFLTEAIPFPAVAFLIVIGEVIFIGMSPNVVAKSFFSDSVFFIMGSLMIATAIIKQSLDKRIALFILTKTGEKIERVVFGIVATTAILAAFIANHTVAAMFLPVGIALTVKSGKDLRSLGKLIMFSIAYGTAIGSLGTPSGGARNVIMIEYWRQMYDINIGYIDWILYAFPMVLVMIPLTTLILLRVFKPEVKDLSVAMKSIEKEVGDKGKMGENEWLSIGIFFVTLIMWITVGETIGLGFVAIIGATLFIIFKLVDWNDYNRGTDWGVVLLYAGAISLGLAMKNTGAARWLAESFLTVLTPIGADSGLLLVAAVSILVMIVSNTMSDGAAVAVTGPITLNMAAISATSLMNVGFATAISSAFAYLLVVGTPSNAIIYASGYIRSTDFVKAGSLMAVMSIAVLLIMAMTWWKILGVN